MKTAAIIIFIAILLGTLAWGILLLSRKPNEQSGQERIAEVTWVQGKVSRRPFLFSSWLPLSVGDGVYHRDEIKTGVKSSVRLKWLSDEQEVDISESAMVEIKHRALKVNGGAVENRSQSSNPFAISVGDVKVVFQTRQGQLMNVKNGGVSQGLIEEKWKTLKGLLKKEELANWEERLKTLNPKDIVAVDSVWVAMDAAITERQLERQDVKITRDEASGAVRAQVAEGSVSLEVEGQAGKVEVQMGEGLILSQNSTEVRRVKLLPPPVLSKPQETVLFNQEELHLEWTPLDLAVAYRVAWGTEMDFSVDHSSVISNEASYLIPLDQDQKEGWLYWKVWALDGDGFEGAKALGRVELKSDHTPPVLRIDDLND